MAVNDYSDKELELFNELGCSDLTELLRPMPMYGAAVWRAFKLGTSGPAVESLRRCIFELDRVGICRMTPAWDALINLAAPYLDPR